MVRPTRKHVSVKTAASPAKAPTYTPARDFVPDAGEPAPLADGIFWLRMPLPFELNHINLWLLESPRGWSLVDTGFNFAETQQHWDRLFAGRLAAKPVENLFVTHFHPDHFGLGAMLSARTGLTVQMTQPEFDMARNLGGDTADMDRLEREYRSYYSEAGLDEGLLLEMLARRFGYRKMVPALPATITPVRPGQTVTLGGRPWKIIGGYGHCPEHACLYDEARKILISGDIVLPSISPNISLYPGSSGDPVGAYLKTLDDIQAQCADDTMVLPSHGVPFIGLHRRLNELRAHHMRRFDTLNTVLSAGPATAFTTMQGLFAHRKLTSFDIFFALGETLAHLSHEVLRGRVS